LSGVISIQGLRLKQKQWIIRPAWSGRGQAAIELGVSETIAQVLYNRGMTDIRGAREFLNPKLSYLQEPHSVPDLLKAAEAIVQACQRKRRIVIYGDYDVDGIAGSAILWHVLTLAGAKVDLYVPHRLEEGYGLNCQAIEKLAKDGAELIITVDCGIRAHEPAKLARANGLDLVITDHHEPNTTLPDAIAVVRPADQDDGQRTQAKPCGAAIAFKLAWEIARQLSGGTKVDPRFRDMLVECTALVALATIADVVPLLDENRILAHFGLQQLAQTRLVGLRALLDRSGLSGDTIRSYHVGFVLAPRLNAAGRMGHARLALELLTRADKNRCEHLADYLEKTNRQRQSLERRIVQQAVELAVDRGFDKPSCPIVVLASEGWHAGVIGIVASKLVDRYGKPAVVIAIEDGLAQGSARSINGYDIGAALDANSQWLTSFGGHAMAGGLRMDSSNIEAFTVALIDHAGKKLQDQSFAPALQIDAVVEPAEINLEFMAQLQRLGPFGFGNPRPVLATKEGQLVGQPRIMGKTGKHISFNIKLDKYMFRAVGFNMAGIESALLDHRRCKLAFNPIINDYNGSQTVELRVCDIKLP